MARFSFDASFEQELAVTSTSAIKKCAGLVVLLLWGGTARAQDISLSITRSTRSLEPTRPIAEPTVKAKSAEKASDTADEARGTQDLTIGLGYEHPPGGGGHTWSASLQYGYVTPAKDWNFRLETGLARKSAPAKTSTGVTDVSLIASRIFSFAAEKMKYQLWLTGGVTAPTHGDVGSGTYQQQGRVVAVAGTGPWTVVIAGVLIHVNGQPASQGGVVRVGHGEVVYEFDNDGGALIGKFDRASPRGVEGSSTATLEYDRPFKKWASSSLEGVFLLTRGLTHGARNTAAEFDLVLHF